MQFEFPCLQGSRPRGHRIPMPGFASNPASARNFSNGWSEASSQRASNRSAKRPATSSSQAMRFPACNCPNLIRTKREQVTVRLRKIILREIHINLLSPFQTSFGTTTLRRILLIEADVDGVIGWGESTAGED